MCFVMFSNVVTTTNEQTLNFNRKKPNVLDTNCDMHNAPGEVIGRWGSVQRPLKRSSSFVLLLSVQRHT